MTGPPYPLPASLPFDPWLTIISQYSNSPILDAMITSFNAAMDQTANIDNFYDLVWNIETAEGYGLDVWGRILGVSRTIQLVGGANPNLGFEEANDPNMVPFGQGTFYTGSTLTTNFSLADSDYLTLLLAKAAGNICDCSVEAINAILLALFPGMGDSYVIDNENMTMDYVFTFALTAIQTAIIAQTGVLPKPVGVLASTIVIPSLPSWLQPYIIPGGIPSIYADFTTEGGTNHYWANGTAQPGFAAWITALGGTYTRATSATYVNSSGFIATAAINAVRPDYNPGTLAAAGILLEGSSTNSFLQSNTFSTTWSTTAPNGVVAQNALGPDGSGTNAWTMTAGSNNRGFMSQIPSGLGTSGNISCWAKAGTDGFAWIDVNDGAGVRVSSFNLSTGALGTQNWIFSGTPVVVLSGGTIEKFPNGWYRISTNWTSATPTILVLGIADADASIVATSGKTGIFYGAQCEETHAFASSYIATTTLTVTRTLDILSFPCNGAVMSLIIAVTMEAFVNAGRVCTTGDVLLSETGAAQVTTSSANPLAYSINSWTSSNIIGVSGSPNGRTIAANGGAALSDSKTLANTTNNTLILGSNGVAGSSFGDFSFLVLWNNVVLTAAQLQALT